MTPTDHVRLLSAFADPPRYAIREAAASASSRRMVCGTASNRRADNPASSSQRWRRGLPARFGRPLRAGQWRRLGVVRWRATAPKDMGRVRHQG
jgi:hypothetical protein